MARIRSHASRWRGYGWQASSPRSRPRGLKSSNAEDRLLAPLRRHWRWTALGLLIAAAAAGTRFVAIGVVPPSLKLKTLARATGSTQLVVGQSNAFIHGLPDLYGRRLSTRAYALADMVASPEVAKYVARAANLPASKIGILGPVWMGLWRAQQWASGPKRASQIIIENDPYQITVNVEAIVPPYPPVIDVETQAPTTATAARLATAVQLGLSTYVRHLQATGVPKRTRYDIRQLVPVSVAPARTSQLANVGVFTLVAVFVLWCGVIVAVSSLSRDLRAASAISKVRGSFHRSSNNERRSWGIY